MTRQTLRDLEWEVFVHPPYSPDLIFDCLIFFVKHENPANIAARLSE